MQGDHQIQPQSFNSNKEKSPGLARFSWKDNVSVSTCISVKYTTTYKAKKLLYTKILKICLGVFLFGYNFSMYYDNFAEVAREAQFLTSYDSNWLKYALNTSYLLGAILGSLLAPILIRNSKQKQTSSENCRNQDPTDQQEPEYQLEKKAESSEQEQSTSKNKEETDKANDVIKEQRTDQTPVISLAIPDKFIFTGIIYKSNQLANSGKMVAFMLLDAYMIIGLVLCLTPLQSLWIGGRFVQGMCGSAN